MIGETFIHYFEKYVDEFLSVFRGFRDSIKNHFHRHPFQKILTVNFISAYLLLLAFPKTDYFILAWIALIPLFFNLDDKKPLKAFTTGYTFGLMFFVGAFYWLCFVTILGMTMMVLYCALYPAIFGLTYALFSRRRMAVKMLVYPSIWVCLEYIRTYFLTGFGWAALGHSQYKNLMVIQIADVTGAFGISFLIVMVNFFLKEYVRISVLQRSFELRKRYRLHCAVVAATVLTVLFYGVFRLNTVKFEDSIQVGVVQGNVEQSRKWIESEWPFILEEYKTLTRQAASETADMIIWPETAYPGFVWETPENFETVKQLASSIKTPLLVGMVTRIQDDYYNSAVLINDAGAIDGQYDKLHLVPFGEYIPFRGQFPFLTDIIPVDDFTAGTEETVLSIRGRLFSVLVCFEDGVPSLVRRFVKKGAQFLVNITNDAWFGDTKAPFMHVQSSVMRAVELRRSVVRAANTGISCFIDPLGRIRGSVKENGVETFIHGAAVQNVPIADMKTVYTKIGDVFTILCFGCILFGVIFNK